MSSGRDVMMEEQQEQVKRPVGRPSAYLPEYCDKAIELGKLGKSKAQIAAAIGVSRQTMNTWAQEFPEFLDAITYAQDLAQAWWEEQGQAGLWMVPEGERINHSLWAKAMSCRFPNDYRESVKQEITGADGAALLSGLTVNFVKSDDKDDTTDN